MNLLMSNTYMYYFKCVTILFKKNVDTFVFLENINRNILIMYYIIISIFELLKTII